MYVLCKGAYESSVGVAFKGMQMIQREELLIFTVCFEKSRRQILKDSTAGADLQEGTRNNNHTPKSEK